MSTETIDPPVAIYQRWTVDLLRQIPHIEGERHELINGELHVTTQPHTRHQIACTRIATTLDNWSQSAPEGGYAISAPGLIYGESEAVAPDVVWVSKERLPAILGKDGKLHDSPELVVEVLSPGKANAERDREKKLDLYARRGVQEYWIADWPSVTIEVYRRAEETLQLAATLGAADLLTSPLLPGFSAQVAALLTI